MIHPLSSDPIGRIDLGACVTTEVTIAPREICSRMHTFMLETSRAASRADKDSLVVQTQGRDPDLSGLMNNNVLLIPRSHDNPETPPVCGQQAGEAHLVRNPEQGAGEPQSLGYCHSKVRYYRHKI